MPSLLIVDDETDILQSLEDLIERELPEVDIRTAEEPLEALRLMEEALPDVILTDFRMPNMNGLAFLEEVKERYGTVPAVLLTAFDERNAAMHAARRGIVRRFYMKPPDPEEVLDGLKELLFPEGLAVEEVDD